MWKVWKFVNKAKYGYGVAIVVASTKYEAFQCLIGHDEMDEEMTDVEHCSEIKELIPIKDIIEPKVILDSLTL